MFSLLGSGFKVFSNAVEICLKKSNYTIAAVAKPTAKNAGFMVVVEAQPLA
jgi:hypothetical protein